VSGSVHKIDPPDGALTAVVDKGSCPPVPTLGKRYAREVEAGFSLLEVMVATALMALVMVGLLQVLSAGLRAQDAVQRRTYALLAAEKVLQQYCREENLASGSHRGKEGTYSYQVNIKPQYQISNKIWDFKVICYNLQVSLSWEERGQAKTLDLQTFRTISHRKQS